MTESKPVGKVGKIQQRILLVRGEKVIVDADLAEFYGVPTKALNLTGKIMWFYVNTLDSSKLRWPAG